MEEILARLSGVRLPLASEAEMQAAIAARLEDMPDYAREHRLTATDRPDFLIGGVVVEVKRRANKRQILRQLTRYAEHPDVAGLILVSGTPTPLPEAINGKPVAFVSVGRAFL